jgi:hypothetical protein
MINPAPDRVAIPRCRTSQRPARLIQLAGLSLVGLNLQVAFRTVEARG